MKILGERIREMRRRRKLTQEDLGKALGVGRTTICGYESGNVVPPALMLKKIAVVLNVSSDYLLGLTESPERQPEDFDTEVYRLAKKIQKLTRCGRKLVKSYLDFLECKRED